MRVANNDYVSVRFDWYFEDLTNVLDLVKIVLVLLN